MSPNPLFPCDNYKEFSLENFSKEECIGEFSVEKNGLLVLADALEVQPVFRCSHRFVFDGMGRLVSVLLKRLAYPCRDSDIIPRFGRLVSEQPSCIHKKQTRRTWRNKHEVQN